MGKTTQTYRENIAAVDLRLADHFPECPRCLELSEPGATICASCFLRLVPLPQELECRSITCA